jgi:hypothetical protein
MGTKRVFIGDIHMGDDRSIEPRKPYVWFKENALNLKRFLDKQWNDPDVSEVVILGDLFDEWIIPADEPPIEFFQTICANNTNKPVIASLINLARSGKLTYVPGNHDMAMDTDGIATTSDLVKTTFPGIHFTCDDTVPLGTYHNGIIAAEHGNRYCLFNAPDSLSNSGASFLPLGYFISRMIAYKVTTTGYTQNPLSIFIDFLKEHWKGQPGFEKDLFLAIADNCGLTDQSDIQLDGLPGYTTMKVGDIADRFSSIYSNWGQVPGAGHVGAADAVLSELEESLYTAAAATYFNTYSPYRVVIFGHTHIPAMEPNNIQSGVQSDNAPDPSQTAFDTIYANSGTWIDNSSNGCTYVETEGATDQGPLWVRVKTYPGDIVMPGYEGFVDI